jgi:hypothetical protein
METPVKKYIAAMNFIQDHLQLHRDIKILTIANQTLNDQNNELRRMLSRNFAGVPICGDGCNREFGCERCNPSPKLEELTCFKCKSRSECNFVDDFYNTNGDCLAEK